MELDEWVGILYLIPLVTAICATLFGVEGRLAKVGAPGRISATIGLVLGIGFIVASVVGVIVGLIVISIITRNDSL